MNNEKALKLVNNHWLFVIINAIITCPISIYLSYKNIFNMLVYIILFTALMTAIRILIFEIIIRRIQHDNERTRRSN